MSAWDRVKWSEASQVLALLDWEELPDVAPPTAAPDAYFGALIDADLAFEAAWFLGQALPRFEAVAWAARSVRDAETPRRSPADEAALKTALLWLQDPTDERRRAAFDAAQEAGQSAEALAAYAVYFSGGSIAPADAPPVMPTPDAAGRFATGAVLVAAARSGHLSEVLSKALATGAQLAVQGAA